MAYNPVLPKGQAAMANSNPVAIASDQGFIGLVTTVAGDPKGFIGLVTVGALIGNVTLSDSKTFIGLTTVTGNVGIFGNVTLSDPKGFIGLVTVTGSVNDGLNPTGTTLNTYSIHLTTNTTTTPSSSTAYISSIAISNEVGGTTSTITIQDKQGTPLKLVNGLATTALTTAPTIISFNTPVKMVSGIDIITGGAVAATVDVWINYYQ
jgi:hypothetical protein